MQGQPVRQSVRVDIRGTPRVSVVLPVRNAAATLDDAIASLCAQHEQHWELWLIDDASSDGSSELAAQWAARDARIHVTANPGNGLVAALNVGLERSRAPLIARMDADDICGPQRLSRQCAMLDAHPELGLVSCRVDFAAIPPQSQADHPVDSGAGYRRHLDWLNCLISDRHISLARFIESPVAHPSVVFRRHCVTAHGGYRDGAFPEDYELWLRWLDAGVRFAKVDACLLTWRDSPGRLSRTDPRYAVDAFYRVKCAYLAKWLLREVPQQRSLWLWGAGRPTRRRFDALDQPPHRWQGFVDIDPAKIGRVIAGRPVIGGADLPAPGRAFVIIGVGSHGAREKIHRFLIQHGYREGIDFIAAA